MKSTGETSIILRMVALWIGIALTAMALYTVLPVSWSPQWWPYVMNFLRGGLPLIALLVGLGAIFIGTVDIQDRREAKKDEEKNEALEGKKDG